MKKIFTIISSLVFFMQVQAQSNKPSPAAWLIQPSVAYQFARGNWAEHFNSNFSAGLGVAYKTDQNWTFGVDGQYLFSDNINDAGQLLNPVLTANGFILNNIGNYASVSVLERGFYFTGELSKTLPFWQANSNSGPDILLGAGFLRHWIEIKNAGNDAPMLLDEYAKGYDHLSQGFLLKQSIGYRYLSRNRRVNLRLSFEMMQAFTTNLRGFDYSTGQSETGTNMDLLYGFRLQWILPLYGASNQTYYFD